MASVTVLKANGGSPGSYFPIKLRPSVKKKWVEALRSGEYEQARSVLQGHQGSMCCLGVLCDVVNPAGWDGTMHRGKVDLPELDFMFEKVLDGRYRNRHNYSVVHSTLQYLARLNDKRRWNFNQIADFVEESF